MSVDREQAKHDASFLADWALTADVPDSVGRVARHCLALLTELEQAEKRLEREQRAADAESEALTLRYQAAKVRLAKVPPLVEAMKVVQHHLDCVDTDDDAIAEDAGTDTARVAASKIAIREALAAWNADD